MRLTYSRNGEERWAFELTRSLNPKDEMLVAIATGGIVEQVDENHDLGSPDSQPQLPFGFSR